MENFVNEFIKFIDYTVIGIQSGSIYALVALGYTMVYGIIKLLNFAHGDFIMVGAYVALFSVPSLLNAGLPALLSVLLGIAVCSVIGVLTERIAYRPLRGASSLSVLITAIAVSLLLQNLALTFFSSSPRPFPQVFPKGALRMGGVNLSYRTVITIVVSIVLMLLLQLFIKKTKMGKAMRAVSEDMGASVLMGINVNAIISQTFAIGSGLAAVASVMYSAAYPLVTPYIGSMLGLKAFVAAVLGGIGSVPGAMLGGFLIGLSESMANAYISSQLADAVVFGILILVLLIKPTGILGKNTGEKV